MKLKCDKCGRPIPAWSEFCPACTSKRKILLRVTDFVKPYKRRAIVGMSMAVLDLKFLFIQQQLIGV